MNKVFAQTLIALLSSTLASTLWAGQFTVNPVRIFMTPKDKAVAVTITNEGDDELVMQADLYTWKQKPDGEDDLVLTEDLLMSPPIIKLAGKSRQVVRLARLSPMKQTEQLTYRMIVREIPEALPSSGSLQLQIAIAFSLPVFITPPKALYKLDCTTERTASDTLKTSCVNTGSAYAQLIDFSLWGADNEQLAGRTTGGYILPGIKRSFDIRSENSKPIPGGKATLSVRLDDGSKQTFDVTLNE